jgi:cytochrome c553
MIYVHKFDTSFAVKNSQENIELGKKLYEQKKCGVCHGSDGSNPPAENYPRINHQPIEYLFTQIKDIQSGNRSNGMTTIMKNSMVKSTDSEIQSISAYLSSVD